MSLAVNVMREQDAATLKLHRLTALLPEMSAQAYAGLVKSIREEGLLDPLVVHNGEVVDGRHRLKACRETGTKVKTQPWDGQGSLVAFVLSKNLTRRHLNSSQRAVVALDAEKEFAAEAKERRLAGLKQNLPKQRTVPQLFEERSSAVEVADATESPATFLALSSSTQGKVSKKKTDGEAAQKAADATGTNRDYIFKAKFVRQYDPRLLEQVMQGELTIPQAVKQVKASEKTAARAATVAALQLEVDGDYAPEIICGDALENLKALGDSTVDLVCTDPPYNMDKAAWDSYGSGQEFAVWAQPWLAECQRVLKPSGALYLFGVNRMLSHLQHVLDRQEMHYRNWLIWDTIQGAGGGLWVNRYEGILYYSKSKTPFEDAEAVKLERYEENIREYKGKTYEFKNPSNIWRFPVVDAQHPDRTDRLTQKPLALIERIVRASCPENGLVVDPFVGSGTTLVAAQRHNRRSIGIDNNSEYVAIARSRVANEAKLQGYADQPVLASCSG